MKRLNQLAIVGLFASGAAWTQGLSTVQVGMSKPGVVFGVDGIQYSSTQTFLWPTGTKHVIQFLFSTDVNTGANLPFQGGGQGNVQFFFSGWTTNTGNLGLSTTGILTITASPDLTSIIGNVTVMYKIHIQFYNSPGPNPNCAVAPGTPGDAPQDGWRYGVVFVDSICVGDNTDMYVTPGNHNFNAFPYPGFAFEGWLIEGNSPAGSFITYNVVGPVTIVPRFMPAKRVSFRTNPTGLNLIVDHTSINPQPGPPHDQLPSGNYNASCNPNYTAIPGAPPLGIAPMCIGDFDFLPGSAHQIGAPQSQQDLKGNWWVFSNFSDGLPQNGTYKTDQNTGTSDLVLANFVPGMHAQFLSSPPGLKFQVDGRDNWPGFSFIWGQAETHQVTAMATQTDAKNRKYQFMGWSNKGAASQTLTMPSDGSDLLLTATYQMLGQVQVTSAPPGLSLTVDGSGCTTPCTLDRLPGTQVQVSAPATIPNSQLSRFDFDGWAGATVTGTGAAGSITFNSDVQLLRASYHPSWALLASANPAGQATFKYSPQSPDGYFPDGTQVSVTVVPAGGYKFTRWGGDLSGVFSTAYLTMDGPHTVSAVLASVPFIPSAGIKNAAGDTPGGTIAPGSIVSIYGQNLASAFQVGPSNPLAQTIAGVTVNVGDYILPLLFVSAQQINAQVPIELADGKYTLVVHNPGQPDVSGSFIVQRDSPGVFVQADPQGAVALALHEDGTPVTSASPARRNETVSIYGTGFGPYDHAVVDGFITPPDSAWKLTDPVAVVAGNLNVQPSWAGAAAGTVGLAIVRLKIDDQIPAAAVLNMSVTVNGVQSNTVQLPVE